MMDNQTLRSDVTGTGGARGDHRSTGKRAKDSKGRIFRMVAALKRCSGLLDLKTGRGIHAAGIQRGDVSDVYVANTLLDMYAKCRKMADARIVFDGMPDHTVVSWTSMIRGYAETGCGEMAFEMYSGMQDEGFEPDRVTLLAVLKACGNLAAAAQEQDGGREEILRRSRGVHRQAVKIGAEMELLVASSLVDVYAKCGGMADARDVFDRMTRRDVVSWTSLVAGYAEAGEAWLALSFYKAMQEQGCAPNGVTFMAALKACGKIPALEAGRRIEAQIRGAGLERDPLVATSLVDFYGKCGCMEEARGIFESISRRDLVAWDALISGYTLQGDSTQVLELLERMDRERVQPDGVIFLSVLAVCSHAGLVDEGLDHFHGMKTRYGLVPGIKHYTCLVDLLGRANRIKQAVELVAGMPMEPDLRIWMVILGACHKWGDAEAGRLAFDSVMRLDDQHAAAYVLMANIYSAAGQRERSEEIVSMGDEAGVVHSFTDDLDAGGLWQAMA